MHPTIYFTKNLIKKLHQERKLLLFCDLHGHSRSYNAFIYGCRCLELPESTKIFPFILSKMNNNFSFSCCKFGGDKFKESTARVCLYNEFRVPAVYTVEASFSGNNQGICFTPQILKSIGRDICRALIPYCGLSTSFTPQPIGDTLSTSNNSPKSTSSNSR